MLQNKEWIFSGVGVFILSTISMVFLKKTKSSQYQKVGDSSKAIQAGGDVKLGEHDEQK